MESGGVGWRFDPYPDFIPLEEVSESAPAEVKEEPDSKCNHTDRLCPALSLQGGRAVAPVVCMSLQDSKPGFWKLGSRVICYDTQGTLLKVVSGDGTHFGNTERKPVSDQTAGKRSCGSDAWSTSKPSQPEVAAQPSPTLGPFP